MDMDSTLITIECIDEIADMQGLKPQVAEITEAAMRGELDFADSLTRRVALLEGLDASALERVYDERLRISMGGEAMLAAVKAAGLKTLLVSGGFTFFTDRLQDAPRPRLRARQRAGNRRRQADRARGGRHRRRRRKEAHRGARVRASWASSRSRRSSWATAPTT